MKPDALFFDIGNVLVLFDYGVVLAKLREGCADPASPDRPDFTPLKNAYERGEIDRPAFMQKAADLLEWKRSLEEMEAIWADIFSPNPPMEKLLERLAGNRLLHISNISDLHREFLGARYPHLRHFSGGIYSHEVGMLKPDPRMFTLALERFELAPDRVLYVDDMEENVIAARGCGIATWHYHAERHGDFENWLVENGVPG